MDSDYDSRRCSLKSWSVNKSYEFVLMGTEGNIGKQRHLWLADSGASCHMCNSKEGFVAMQKKRSAITIGDGNSLESLGIGTWKGIIGQAKGKNMSVTLENVHYVPGLCGNLFGLNQSLQKGWKLGNDGPIITLSKKGATIRFAEKVETSNGWVMGCVITPHQGSGQEMGMVTTLEKGATDINKNHRILGHSSEDTVKKTAADGVHNLFARCCRLMEK